MHDNKKRKKGEIVIGTDAGSRLIKRRLPKNKATKHIMGKKKTYLS